MANKHEARSGPWVFLVRASWKALCLILLLRTGSLTSHLISVSAQYNLVHRVFLLTSADSGTILYLLEWRKNCIAATPLLSHRRIVKRLDLELPDFRYPVGVEYGSQSGTGKLFLGYIQDTPSKVHHVAQSCPGGSFHSLHKSKCPKTQSYAFRERFIVPLV